MAESIERVAKSTASGSLDAHTPPEPHALIVSEVFPPEIGGSGELLSNIYRRLHGVTVSVLTQVIEGTPAEEVDPDGLTIIRRVMRNEEWGWLRPSGAARHLRTARLVSALIETSSTVVHSGRALPEGVGVWLACRLSGTPYVCWAHGEDVVAAAQSRELTGLMRLVYGGAAFIVANSHNTAALVRPFVSHGRIEVVHPGVDAARFARSAEPATALRQRLAKEGETVLLTVGRLQRRKGHDVTLQALATLRSAGLPLRYVIVGDGEERARLEALAHSLGVAAFTEFVGRVDSRDLPTYYGAADIFCHPNRVENGDIEGFGIVFLEAAASGLPVIGGDSGGAAEAVERDVTGVLVSGERPDELALAISRLARDPDARRAMGQAGRHRATTLFSWERAAAKTGRLQSLALRGRRRAPSGGQ
jgi:phosphatidylinositol alpha-1,6-mannosyltransferase